MLESSHQDKDYPFNNNIAVGNGLSAKVGHSFCKRESRKVKYPFSKLWYHREDNTIEGGGGALKVWKSPSSSSSLETLQIRMLEKYFSHL